MFISYSTQAKEALDGLATFSSTAYIIAMLRIQGELASVPDGAMAETVTAFSVDDDEFVVALIASVSGVQATVHELDWQVR